MPRRAFWTLLVVTITLVLVPGTAVAQEETAWEALVRENPSLAEEGATPRLERQVLQRLTPEQAERFAAGHDASTIFLGDGRDLGTAMVEGFNGPGGVYIPVDSCKLTGAGVPGGDLYPDGDTEITVRGTCGIPTEAVGLVVNIKVPSPTEGGRVSLFPAGGGVFGPGFLNFSPGTGFNNAVVVELCEGTCASGDLVVRMVNISAPQQVILHTMGYFAPGSANPDPPCFDNSTRFVACGNGTVTDTVTGIIYLVNANCFGQENYAAANNAAAALADGQCGLTDGSRAGDWRLQTKEEWEAIVDPTCPMAPKIVGNGPSGGCYTDNPWASGVQSSSYWSSTTYAIDADNAWTVFMGNGAMNTDDKTDNDRVWPVRGGQ